MRCLNEVTLYGRLVAPAQFRAMPSGDSVCNLEVETREKWKGEERVTLHPVAAFGKVADVLRHQQAGAPILVRGALRARTRGQQAWYETVAMTVVITGEQLRVGDAEQVPA